MPAKTPSAVVERLRTEVGALMASPAFIERMREVGIEILAMPADAFEAFTKEERARWAKTIDALNVKID